MAELAPRELLIRIAEPPKVPPGLAAPLTQVLGFGAVFAALVYSLGWSYAYEWFRIWKMPLAALEVPDNQLFEYGRLTLVDNSYVVIPVLLFAAGGLWVLRRFLPRLAPAMPAIVLALLAAAWFACHALGRLSANSSFEALARTNFEFLQLAEVTIKDEDSRGVPPDLTQDIAPGRPCYRLVFMSKNNLWLARTYDGDRDPLVAAIPLDSVVTMRLYPQMGNCTRQQ